MFRPATSPILFSALIGTGYQIAFVATCTVTIAILGELYTESVIFNFVYHLLSVA